jgi:hypothetical protein
MLRMQISTYEFVTYVCDCSLGTHEFMYSILSLKLGVTNWYQNHVDCRTQT